VQIEVTPPEAHEFNLHVRIPSWAYGAEARVNGVVQELTGGNLMEADSQPTASGYDPRTSRFWSIQRTWALGDVLKINFEMDIQLRRAHPRIKGHRGKAAITRGPLVYCLESVDNLDMDIFNVYIDPDTLKAHFNPDLLGGTSVITGKSMDSLPLTLIPYHLWGNRGPSQMTVWVNGGKLK
jgi:DUF1680 family protein